MGDGCQYSHRYTLNITRDILSAYRGIPEPVSRFVPDRPNFIWNWISIIPHNAPDGMPVIDKDFVNAFHEMRSDLDRAVVIGMGDHGCRAGKVYLFSFGREFLMSVCI